MHAHDAALLGGDRGDRDARAERDDREREPLAAAVVVAAVGFGFAAAARASAAASTRSRNASITAGSISSPSSRRASTRESTSSRVMRCGGTTAADITGAPARPRRCTRSCRSSSRRRWRLAISRYFSRCGSSCAARLGLVEPRPQVGDVVAQRPDALARHLLAHEVGDQQPQQRLALDRREGDRRLRPRAQRLEPLVGQRVDRPLARLARLLARLEVAELGQPLGLDVVLAFARPVEDPAAPGHLQQVVRAHALAADEAEDLVREQAELRS